MESAVFPGRGSEAEMPLAFPGREPSECRRPPGEKTSGEAATRPGDSEVSEATAGNPSEDELRTGHVVNAPPDQAGKENLSSTPLSPLPREAVCCGKRSSCLAKQTSHPRAG